MRTSVHIDFNEEDGYTSSIDIDKSDIPEALNDADLVADILSCFSDAHDYCLEMIANYSKEG